MKKACPTNRYRLVGDSEVSLPKMCSNTRPICKPQSGQKSSQEGSKEDESITANTKEGLAVNMDVSISYTLDPNRIPDLYVKYRAEIQRYFEENPNVYHAPKEVYEHLLPEKNYKQ